MFMLRNSIEDYVSTSLRTANLSSDEQQHFSFLITKAEKQLLGYKPYSEAQYFCHFTNRRLILEPQTNVSSAQFTSKLASRFSVSDDTTFYQIPYEEIASFKVIRSLNLATCVKVAVKVALKSTLNISEDELVFVASPPSQSKMAKQWVNCSTDFATLGNLMLQVDETIVQQIQNSPVPVLVNFWAPNCKPCEMFAPVVDEVMEQFVNQVRLIKVNLNDGPGLPIRYGVDGAPTVLIFKDGVVVEKIQGAIPVPLFTKVLRKYL